MLRYGAEAGMVMPQSRPKHPSQTILLSRYLEGQRDIVSRLIIGISGVTIWVIGGINLLTKYPWPSK